MEMMQANGDWSDVDRTGHTEQFVHYLDTVGGMAWVNAFKRRTYHLLEPREEMRLLDVGCGTGDDVRALAALVAPSGEAVGIDSSAAMIAEAQQRAAATDLPVAFHVGDAHALPFPDDSFDGVRAERTLQHVRDPHRAVAEMVRVARPGGRIVVGEGDFDTLAIDAADRTTTRAIVHAIVDSRQSGWVIRQMPATLRQLALREIGVASDTWILTDYAIAAPVLGFVEGARAAQAGTIGTEDAARWFADQEARAAAGMFYCTITAFTVSGRKP